MSENNVLRRYNFSDAELKQAATTQLSLILRDIADFSREGFDANAELEYQTKLDYFYSYPSDELLESDKITHTESKNLARKDLEQKIRMMQYIVQVAFPKNQSYHRAFGNADLTRQNDFQMMHTGMLVQQAAVKYFQELQPFGLTQTKINDIDLALNKFTEAYQAQQRAIHQRDISTSERVEAGNAVYDLFARYARLGQIIYLDKSDPRRDDYVIYYAPATTTNSTVDTTIKDDKKTLPPKD